MILVWAAVARAAISWEQDPRAGTESVIAVVDDAGAPRSGQTVRVVHRPGLAGEKEVAIGITDGRGRVRWTPDAPGVARLRAGDEEQLVRVGADHVDPTPLLILGLLLATGAGALVVALREARA